MKIAIIGDTHWGNKNDSPVFYDYFNRCYEWIFETLDKHNVVDVIQVGDMFDRRKFINFKTLYEARETFLQRLNSGFNTYAIVGNHDVFYKNTNKVNSLDLLLGEFKNIKVNSNKPMTVNIAGIDVDMYPWITEDNYSECVEYAATKNNSKVAVGHFEFANFELYKGRLADHGMNHKIFERYDVVFSGHYHTHSVKDNIVYTGIPYELMWSDWSDQKGIVLLDTETLQWEFVPNPISLFTKVYYDDSESVPSTEFLNITGKYVKLVVSRKTNIEAYEKFFDALMRQEPLDLKVVEESVQAAIDDVEDAKLEFDDTPTLMETFVDGLDEIDLEKPVLKNMLRNLYTEANTFKI
ncbi:recombination endonuclease subunit [Synechococcus phage BUCT-ZZ01]|nr:recombination endonuclease subunit [Synechococcus phage BUCT-ZZ01]